MSSCCDTLFVASDAGSEFAILETELDSVVVGLVIVDACEVSVVVGDNQMNTHKDIRSRSTLEQILSLF